MKTRILIILIVIVIFVLISFAIPNLSKVYDSCEMAQTRTLQFAIGYTWTNGLFYIDNAECTWKLFGVIPIASILDDERATVSDNTAAQLEAILGHCIDSKDLVDTVGLSYHNGTHSIDTVNCEWEIIEKGSFGNSLIEKNRNELSQVLDWCNDELSVKYGFYNYSNETHSINTSTCEWKEHVPYPTKDSLCVPFVEKWILDEEIRNQTHIFDASSCTWKIDQNYDFANSKGCPQFCPKEENPPQRMPLIPSYDSELMQSLDSSLYYPVLGMGSPLVYKETSKPVLDETNCERYAFWMTEHQIEKIHLYEDYPRYPPWGNQIFPLVGYCLEQGDLAKIITENKIYWSFYRIVDRVENEN